MVNENRKVVFEMLDITGEIESLRSILLDDTIELSSTDVIQIKEKMLDYAKSADILIREFENKKKGNITCSYILVRADRKGITLKSVLAISDQDALAKFGITDQDMNLSMAVNEIEYRLISLINDLWIAGTCASNTVYDFS